MNNKQYSQIMAASALAVLLTACGGGGGGDSQPGNDTDSPAPPTETVIEAGVPVAYAPGSIEAFTLSYINSQMTHCGYAPMRGVVDLTAAATAHANYIALNGDVMTHDEVQSNPGFTGQTHRERLRAAGASEARANSSSEGIGGTSVNSGKAANGLIAAPMHQADLLDGWSEIGVGTPSGQGPVNLASDSRLTVLAFGGERQSVAQGTVRNYPCEGTEGLISQGTETPNPLPALVAGISGGLTFETSRTGALEVDSMTLTDGATGAPLQVVRAVGPAGYTLANSAKWRTTYVATPPLKDGAVYRVSAKGRTWSTADKAGTPTNWVREYTFKTFTFSSL